MAGPHYRDLRRPDYLLALGFGSGLVPIAPGTVGSLLALVLFVPLLSLNQFVLLGFIVVALVLGIWVSGRVADHMAVKDPSVIVFDEFVGMWIALLWLPDLYWLPVAFLAFRVFDILKPWPVSLADRELDGGLGIMLDDVIAGMYALACVQLGNLAIPGSL